MHAAMEQPNEDSPPPVHHPCRRRPQTAGCAHAKTRCGEPFCRLESSEERSA
jgi:hypothetical protein